jgi:hypothetical protein
MLQIYSSLPVKYNCDVTGGFIQWCFCVILRIFIVENVDFGIQINDGHNNVISGNGFYGSRGAALHFTAGSFANAVYLAHDNLITGNNFETINKNKAYKNYKVMLSLIWIWKEKK